MAIEGGTQNISVQPYTKTVRTEIFTEGTEADYLIRVWRQDGFSMPDGSFLSQGAWRSLQAKPAELPDLADYVQIPEALAQRLTQPLAIADILALLPTFVALAADALDRKTTADQQAASQAIDSAPPA